MPLIRDLDGFADAATSGVATYARESLTLALIGEIQPLLDTHYDEIAFYKDIPLAPDWWVYKQKDESGQLRIYTARTPFIGDLIGYAVFFVGQHPHYMGSKQAHGDLVFLLPDYRRGGAGLQLIRFAETQLQAEHVQLVSHHAKVTHPQFQRLLEHEGYEPMDVILVKRLDR